MNIIITASHLVLVDVEGAGSNVSSTFAIEHLSEHMARDLVSSLP